MLFNGPFYSGGCTPPCKILGQVRREGPLCALPPTSEFSGRAAEASEQKAPSEKSPSTYNVERRALRKKYARGIFQQVNPCPVLWAGLRPLNGSRAGKAEGASEGSPAWARPFPANVFLGSILPKGLTQNLRTGSNDSESRSPPMKDLHHLGSPFSPGPSFR